MTLPPLGHDRRGPPDQVTKEVPISVAFTSPVNNSPWTVGDPAQTASLPLNLVATIVSYIEDVGDLARVCRTSRLMYYMSLPQLYAKVSLHSYPDLRYINGRPEGFGSGSPFVMALNGLVTKAHASLVHELRIWGKWREVGVEEFVKGRIPDNNMMLSILLRAATDKMARLQSFSWELDCKPSKTLYEGLTTHTSITRLTIRFPSTRVPRPSVMIPPMSNLRAFKAIDIDPLCYPDDISMLIFGSKRLEDLRLHFSPRMRQEAEPTLQFETYFGRCLKAGQTLKLKHLGIQNFFGMLLEGMEKIIDWQKLRSCTNIDTFGGATSPAKNVFVDDSWKSMPAMIKTACEVFRGNDLAPQGVAILANQEAPLVSFYIINNKFARNEAGSVAVSPMNSTPSDATSPMTPETPAFTADPGLAGLRSDYVHVLTRCHGPSLRHLLLSDQWALTPEDLADIVRYCYNLEQLGVALNVKNHHYMRLLMPFLPRLTAIRVLYNDSVGEHLQQVSDEERLEGLSIELVGAVGLQYVGVADRVHKLGGCYEVQMEDGTMETRRHVTLVSLQEVQHIEIWKMDVPDISVDPVGPFDP